MQPRSLITPLAVALATCAIAPAVGSAAPTIEGQGVAAGGGPGVTAKQFESQNLAAPDQVDRVRDQTANVYIPPTPTASTPTSAAPVWPTGPQPAATRHAPTSAPVWPTGPQPAATRHAPVTATAPSDDGGIDVWLIVGLSGGALLLAGGLGVAGRKHIRQRQLA
jgi:hypothetical protein